MCWALSHQTALASSRLCGAGLPTPPAPPRPPASHVVGHVSVLPGCPEQRCFSLLNFQKENGISIVSTNEADMGLGTDDPARLFLGRCSGLGGGQDPTTVPKGCFPLPSSLTGDRGHLLCSLH